MQVHIQQISNRILKTLHTITLSLAIFSTISIFNACVQAASIQMEMTIEANGRKKCDESVWLLMGKDQTLSSEGCEVFALEQLEFNVRSFALVDVNNHYRKAVLQVENVHTFLSTTPLITQRNPHIHEILNDCNNFLINNNKNSISEDSINCKLEIWNCTCEHIFFTLMHLCMQNYIDVASKQQIMKMMICDMLPLVKPVTRLFFEGVSYDCFKEEGFINIPFVIRRACDSYFATHEAHGHFRNAQFLLDTQKYMQHFNKKYPNASTNIKFSAKEGMLSFKRHTNNIIEMLSEIPAHIALLTEQSQRDNHFRNSAKYRLQQKIKGRNGHPLASSQELKENEASSLQAFSDSELISFFNAKSEVPSPKRPAKKKHNKRAPKQRQQNSTNVLQPNANIPDSPVRILKRDAKLANLPSPVCIEQMPQSDDGIYSDEELVMSDSLPAVSQEESMPNIPTIKAEFNEAYYSVLDVINPRAYVCENAKVDLDAFMTDATLELGWVLAREDKAEILNQFADAKKEIEELGQQSRLFTYLLSQFAHNIIKAMYERSA